MSPATENREWIKRKGHPNGYKGSPLFQKIYLVEQPLQVHICAMKPRVKPDISSIKNGFLGGIIYQVETETST